MMKRRYIIIIAAVLAVTTVAVVVIQAYLHNQGSVDNSFTPAMASCVVEETFENNIKSNVTVKNTGEKDVYVRIIAVTYWQDSKGAIVGRQSENLNWNEILNKKDWIEGPNNTFYYKTTVSTKDSTTDLLAEGKTIKLAVKKTEGDVIYTYHQVVEFVAEVIQVTPTTAVTDSWGVTLDSNGNITEVKSN